MIATMKIEFDKEDWKDAAVICGIVFLGFVALYVIIN